MVLSVGRTMVTLGLVSSTYTLSAVSAKDSMGLVVVSTALVVPENDGVVVGVLWIMTVPSLRTRDSSVPLTFPVLSESLSESESSMGSPFSSVSAVSSSESFMVISVSMVLPVLKVSSPSS